MAHRSFSQLYVVVAGLENSNILTNKTIQEDDDELKVISSGKGKTFPMNNHELSQQQTNFM